MRNRAEIVLEALLMGLEVDIGMHTYCLDANKNLCCTCYTFDSNNDMVKDNNKLIKVDFTLGQFIKTCEEMDKMEIMNVAANLALN